MKIIGFIDKKKIDAWLDSLKEDYSVYLPVQDSENGRIDYMDYTAFQEEKSGKGFTINFSEKTRLSPKKAFFPSTEKLLDFEYKKDLTDPDNIKTDLSVSEAEKDDMPILLFGVKPCDATGLIRLDIFYGGNEKKDKYYLNRKKDSIVISMGCTAVFPDCFCTSVDGHPFDFENADIGLVEAEKGYFIVKANEKGKELLVKSKKFIESRSGKAEDETMVKKIASDAEDKISQYWKGIDKSEMADKMARSMSTDIWKDITAKCISCGACTYVCPTCFCFNIRDDQKGLAGERYRCWDYCMNSYYTLEASGHNPRAEKDKRYRNKVNCKYNYNIKRSDNIFCVGCGRCIDVCPVAVDIREAVDTVLENDSNIKDQ